MKLTSAQTTIKQKKKRNSEKLPDKGLTMSTHFEDQNNSVHSNRNSNSIRNDEPNSIPIPISI